MFRPKRTPVKLTRTQAMACIPVKGGHVQESRLETGEILLAYPDYKQPWFTRLFRGPGRSEKDAVRIKKLQLDALGTAVWELLDGRRSVQQIIERFTDKYSLHAKEAEVSVSQFLRELGRRELIGMR